MPFFGTITILGGKSKAKKHIQMTQRYVLDIFRETRSVMVPRFEFFPEFTDKG